MSKIVDPIVFLESLGIGLDVYHAGKIQNRNVRYLPEYKCIDIGDNDFDRWGNSVELSFDLGTKKGQREFKKWYLTFRG